MTKAKAAQKCLNKLSEIEITCAHDPEALHNAADAALLELLNDIGMIEVVNLYEALSEKFYYA